MAKTLAGRAESIRNLSGDYSLMARYDLGLQAMQRWIRNPLLGTGLGDFVRYRIFPLRIPFPYLDSSYLQVLWKLGLLGLLPFLILYLLFLKRVWFVYRHATSEFQMLCAVSTFVAFVALAMIGIESGILANSRYNLLYAVMMGIFDRWAREIRRSKQPAVSSEQ
jgi:O-antigen ligase